MSDIENRTHAVVSQFASEWLGSTEAKQLRSLPSISRARLLSGAPAGEWTEGLLAGRPKGLMDELLSLSPTVLLRESAEARVSWLVHDLLNAVDKSAVNACVSSFVKALLAPTKQVLHSFTLAAFELRGIEPGARLPIVNGWEMHVRGMPLDGRALVHLSGLGSSQVPLSMTRFSNVSKGSDPLRLHFLGWVEAQLILEGLRLFAPSGCFFVQEDFSPDYHYIAPVEYVPALLPSSPARYCLSPSQWGELQAFIEMWLQITPSRETPSTKEAGRNAIRQALRRLRDGYDGGPWQEAVLDTVSGLELLLIRKDDELSFRLAIRAAHLLSVLEPDKAGDVFTKVRRLYEVRSSIAHGDWDEAAERAIKRWPATDESAVASGSACATFGIELLRRAILTQAYFTSRFAKPEEILDEKVLLNPTERERLREMLQADSANPLIRALLNSAGA